MAQVGVGGFRIDLGIRAPDSDRYVLGVECDGAAYHSSKTARDRDRLRQQVLENLGWNIHRVWSTDWIKDPVREVEKVLATYERAKNKEALIGSLNAPIAQPAVIEDQLGDVPERDVNGYPRNNAPAKAPQPYCAARLPHQGTIDTFKSAGPEYLAELLGSCVATEGPVHVDRAMRVVAESFGIARVGGLIRGTLLGALEHPAAATRIERRGEFLWPTSDVRLAVRGPDPQGAVRPIREVPPEEIGLAVEAVLDDAFSLNRDDLVVAAARLLGYDRTGANVGAAVTEVVDRMILQDALTVSGEQVRLAAHPE